MALSQSSALQLVVKNSFWDVIPKEAQLRHRSVSDELISYGTYEFGKLGAQSICGSTEDGGSDCCSSECGSISVEEFEGSTKSSSSREASPGPPPRVAVESLKQVQGQIVPGFQASTSRGSNEVRRAQRQDQEKLQCQFLVGIEEESRFRVARRLLGSAGAHVKAIAAETGVRLRLRGRGSKFLEGPERQESTDPLMLCVSAPGREAYDEAVRRVTAILEQIYMDFQSFSSRNGRRPALLQVQLHEGPREGSC